MINFYNKLPKDIKQETKLGKDFKDHYILPHSMIAIIGGTGSGKSNALLNLISKQSSKYYEIIIFNPVSTDEPLLKLLQKKIPELKLISNIEELPSLSEFVGDSEHEKLIVFDDVINMSFGIRAGSEIKASIQDGILKITASQFAGSENKRIELL